MCLCTCSQHEELCSGSFVRLLYHPMKLFVSCVVLNSHSLCIQERGLVGTCSHGDHQLHNNSGYRLSPNHWRMTDKDAGGNDKQKLFPYQFRFRNCYTREGLERVCTIWKSITQSFKMLHSVCGVQGIVLWTAMNSLLLIPSLCSLLAAAESTCPPLFVSFTN